MPSVLITGAGRGIGRVTATRLADAGWNVFAGVRDMDAGKQLAAETDRITPVQLDVTDPTHLAALGEHLPHRLDAVVNNAGIAVLGSVETLPVENLRRQLEVNVIGQVAVTQAVLPRLRASRGRVVFLSSITGRVSPPMEGAYNASKSAIEALADSLRVELRPWGIRVVLIEPGAVATDNWRELDNVVDELQEAMSDQQRDLYATHSAGLRAMVAKLQKRAVPVEKAAAAIERALTARRPHARYIVGRDARAMLAMRTLAPTPLLDAAVARVAGLR